jgi:hypothetical protein
VGIELWTMTEDILFSNIYVGHSFDDAKVLAAETYEVKKSLESALSSKKDIVDDSDYYIPSLFEDPVAHVRGKFALFFDAAREDPVSAIITYWDTSLVLTGAIFTLFGMLGVLFGLVGSQQKPVAKVSITSFLVSVTELHYYQAKKTDTSTPDDKQKPDSTPVAPAGGEKKDESTAKRRK